MERRCTTHSSIGRSDHEGQILSEYGHAVHRVPAARRGRDQGLRRGHAPGSGCGGTDLRDHRGAREGPGWFAGVLVRTDTGLAVEGPPGRLLQLDGVAVGVGDEYLRGPSGDTPLQDRVAPLAEE